MIGPIYRMGGSTMELFMANKTLVFNRLKHSLELLAAPSEIQLRFVPDFGYRADELYLGFDHWRSQLLVNFESELAADQRNSLNSLQELFVLMDNHCWNDTAVACSSEWENVRRLSARALGAFGWSDSAPLMATGEISRRRLNTPSLKDSSA